MEGPIPSFGVLDILVVLLYVIAVTALGVFISRGQTSKRDYFLGGRSLSWWVVGFSIVATETSALTFIGVPAISLGALKLDPELGQYVAENGNLLFIQLIIGYVIGRVIIAWKIVPLYFTGDVYTPYQLLSRAFGSQARYAASGLQLIGMALGAAVRVYAVAIPLTLVVATGLPNWGVTHSIILIMVVALLYTSIGGIKAVVWTDMIQYFIFVGGGLFAVFYIPTLIEGANAAPSGAEGWSGVFEVAGDNLRFFSLGWDFGAPFTENLSRMFTGEFNIIMGIFPTTIGIIFAFGFDQLNVQRVLGCKDQKEGSKAMLFSAGLIFPQFFLFLMVGVVLYAFYTITNFNLGMDPWDPSKVVAGEETKPIADYVFPIWIITYAPTVIKGFLIAGILAAAMSSVSSALSAMGSMVTMDFYRPLVGKSDEKSELKLSRAMTVVSGLILGGLAIMFIGAEDIIGLAFTVAGLTAGGILGAFAFGMWKGGGPPTPVVIGIVTSFITMSVLNVLWGGNLKTFVTKVFGEFEPPLPSITWPWHALIGMTVCVVAIAATRPFFSQQTDRNIGAAGADED